MKQKVIYALDFDGVICDSAVETAMTGWKAASLLWNDINTPLPSQKIIDQFRQVRPMMETGYEAILIMRLLYDGESVNHLLTAFAEKKQQALELSTKEVVFLKKLFGEVRDEWINQAMDEWITMNPLFNHVAEKLQKLSEQKVLWYIITTKQERFVHQILKANNIELSADNIFGLDRHKSKQETLTELLVKHPLQEFYFVEDRLPTLTTVLANNKLNTIKLFLATWGYNTEQDKQQADKQSRIKLIGLDDFLS